MLHETVKKLREDAVKQDKKQQELCKEIKTWKQKLDSEKHESEFYHRAALDAKRKNKLLKVAVGRLQNEYDKLKEKYEIADNELSFANQL